MREAGADIRVVGLLTLAQAPWTFKMLWSPFMDRFVPPFWGRRRGWAAITQIALFALTLALAGLGNHPEAVWVIGAFAFAIAFASASQDIAIDAYAVDVLRPAEQGVAVGARIALYRAAMFLAGALSITLASKWSWPAVLVMIACCYLPMVIISGLAPEPEEKIAKPKSLKEAVWLPFLEALSRHRALEILAFVILYKLADNLAGSLLRPFLVDMEYTAFYRGFALGTVGLVATLLGTFIGGVCTTPLGLSKSLWIFGFLQIISNVGYVAIGMYGKTMPGFTVDYVATGAWQNVVLFFKLMFESGPKNQLLFAAMGFESFTQGLGTGAFGVLLIRMTKKRFSATQFALFTSMFAIPRILAGPISGVTVYSVGWVWFFWFTMAAGIPGLILLWRFCPWGVREPEFSVSKVDPGPPLTSKQLVVRGLVGGILGFISMALCSVVLAALRVVRTKGVEDVDFVGQLTRLFSPEKVGDWIRLLSILVLALILGFAVAAISAARHGASEQLRRADEDGVQ